MKITFEGKTIHDVLEEMASVLAATTNPKPIPVPAGAKGPGPDLVANALPANVPVDKPVDNPVDSPVDKPPEKVKDPAKVAAMNKARAAKDAKRAAAAAPAPIEPLFEEPKAPIDPVEVVKIRQKTIEDLQSAYANGHQKEVFELLSRFGNGAKSFRELPPDAFVPISEAISKGALT